MGIKLIWYVLDSQNRCLGLMLTTLTPSLHHGITTAYFKVHWSTVQTVCEHGKPTVPRYILQYLLSAFLDEYEYGNIAENAVDSEHLMLNAVFPAIRYVYLIIQHLIYIYTFWSSWLFSDYMCHLGPNILESLKLIYYPKDKNARVLELLYHYFNCVIIIISLQLCAVIILITDIIDLNDHPRALSVPRKLSGPGE